MASSRDQISSNLENKGNKGSSESVDSIFEVPNSRERQKAVKDESKLRQLRELENLARQQDILEKLNRSDSLGPIKRAVDLGENQLAKDQKAVLDSFSEHEPHDIEKDESYENFSDEATSLIEPSYAEQEQSFNIVEDVKAGLAKINELKTQQLAKEHEAVSGQDSLIGTLSEDLSAISAAVTPMHASLDSLNQSMGETKEKTPENSVPAIIDLSATLNEHSLSFVEIGNYSPYDESYSFIGGHGAADFHDSMSQIQIGGDPIFQPVEAAVSTSLPIYMGDVVQTLIQGHKLYEGIPKSHRANIRKLLVYESIMHKVPEIKMLSEGFEFKGVNDRENIKGIIGTKLLIGGIPYRIMKPSGSNGGFSRGFEARIDNKDDNIENEHDRIFIKFVDTGMFDQTKEPVSNAIRSTLLESAWKEIQTFDDLSSRNEEAIKKQLKDSENSGIEIKNPIQPLRGIPKLLGVLALTEDGKIIDSKDSTGESSTSSYFVHTEKHNDGKTYLQEDGIQIPDKAIIAMSFEGAGEELPSTFRGIKDGLLRDESLKRLESSDDKAYEELYNEGLSLLVDSLVGSLVFHSRRNKNQNRQAQNNIRNFEQAFQKIAKGDYNAKISFLQNNAKNTSEANSLNIFLEEDNALDTFYDKTKLLKSFILSGSIQQREYTSNLESLLYETTGLVDLAWYNEELRNIIRETVDTYEFSNQKVTDDFYKDLDSNSSILELLEKHLPNGLSDEYKARYEKLMSARADYGKINKVVFEEMKPEMQEFLEILNQVHTYGKVHKDIKPGNILKGAVIDFGLTLDLSEAHGTVEMITQSLVGTINTYLVGELGLESVDKDLLESKVLDYLSSDITKQSIDGFKALLNDLMIDFGISSSNANDFTKNDLFAYKPSPKELKEGGAEARLEYDKSYYAYEYYLNGDSDAAWLTLANELNFADNRMMVGTNEYMHPYTAHVYKDPFLNRKKALSQVCNSLNSHLRLIKVKESKGRSIDDADFNVFDIDQVELFIEYYNSILANDTGLSSNDLASIQSNIDILKDGVEGFDFSDKNSNDGINVDINYQDVSGAFSYFSKKHLDMELVGKYVSLGQKEYDYYSTFVTLENFYSEAILDRKRPRLVSSPVQKNNDLFSSNINSEYLGHKRCDGSKLFANTLDNFVIPASIISGDISLLTKSGQLPDFVEVFTNLIESYQDLSMEDQLYLRAQLDLEGQNLHGDFDYHPSKKPRRGSNSVNTSFMYLLHNIMEDIELSPRVKRDRFQKNMKIMFKALHDEKEELASFHENKKT